MAIEFKRVTNVQKVKFSLESPIGAYLYDAKGKVQGRYQSAERMTRPEITDEHCASRHDTGTVYRSSGLGNKKVSSHAIMCEGKEYHFFTYR